MSIDRRYAMDEQNWDLEYSFRYSPGGGHFRPLLFFLSLSVYLLILIPKLLSALICQRPFVFVCEFLVSNDPPPHHSVLQTRQGSQWSRRHVRCLWSPWEFELSRIPSSTLSRKLRSRYLVEGGLLCRSDYILINFLQWEGTYSTSWHGVDTDIWGFRVI